MSWIFKVEGFEAVVKPLWLAILLLGDLSAHRGLVGAFDTSAAVGWPPFAGAFFATLMLSAYTSRLRPKTQKLGRIVMLGHKPR